MFRIFFSLALTSLFYSISSAQETDLVNYSVYSFFLKTEIIKKTKSVTIITKLNNDTSFSWLTNPAELREPQHLEELRFLTRDHNGNPVTGFDIATQNLIIDFYTSHLKDTLLQNKFNIPGVKVFLIDKSPILKGTEQEWKKFYKGNQGSGGIFQFSNIHYSPDGKQAIFYHSVHRRGLNAHGALAIMENTNGDWKLKYHINFWQA